MIICFSLKAMQRYNYSIYTSKFFHNFFLFFFIFFSNQ
jgi:hypothetical protein